MTKTLDDSKKQNSLIKDSLLASKKTGKAGVKSRKNKGKKPAAGGSKAKGKKGGSKKKGSGKNTKSNKTPDDSKEKEQSSSKEKEKDERKSIMYDYLTSCHPSNPESCKCGTSMDYTVASFPRSAD